MERNRDFQTLAAVSVLVMTLLRLTLAQYGGGTGDPNDPYQIWTAEQMNAIGADPNDWDNHFQLMGDIDLSAYSGDALRMIGKPLGGRGGGGGGPAFQGVFDGHGHTIANLSRTSAGDGGVGLFRYISGPHAEIKDLTLLRPNLDAGGGSSVGALVGWLEEGAITGCHIEDGTVTGERAVGALVGFLTDGTITNCRAKGSTITGNYTIGGLVGDLRGGTITGCHSQDGAITGYDTVGAIVGHSTGGIISDCHVAGGITTGRECLGGLAGDLRGGNVTGCHVKDATVTWSYDTRGDRVGGLVGYSWDGTITDCHVENGTIIGNDYVGGLGGDCNETTTVECHATGIVIGNDYVGGLCGIGSGVRCSATATVLGHDYVGGLLGSGSATDCYATGSVVGNNYVGGLAGYSESDGLTPDWPGFWPGTTFFPDSSAFSGGIIRCYAACMVVGDAIAGGYDDFTGDFVGRRVGDPLSGAYRASVGGLVGFINDPGYVIGSFWDAEVSGQPTSAGGERRTTAQMQTGATFSTWNAAGNAGVWTIDEGRDYPRLAWEDRPGAPIGSGLLAGSGTPDDPYLIYTVEDLWFLTKSPDQWDRCFKLMANLDLAEYAGTGLASIGSMAQPFTGVFDGNGHTISGYINTDAAGGWAGLFGYVYGPGSEHEWGNIAVISNLGLIDPVVDGRKMGDTGALVSILDKGLISGCYVEGGLVVGGSPGGLVGYSGGTVRDCCASTRVIGLTAGGLVGRSPYGTIVNCYATGAVTGTSYVGGLVGGSSHGTIADCYATGTVTGASYVGGLVGGSSHGTIANCHATGIATGGSVVGGLVGESRDSSIANCYATGTVTGTDDLGGLVGLNVYFSSITDSYAIGHVSGKERVGGLVGTSDRGSTVTASFWDVETSGRVTSAGGTGLTTAEMQTASTFLEAGWDFVGETENGTEDIWWILEGQDYPRLWWEAVDE